MKIISTKDAASNGVKLLVYGASGSGKTKLIDTADKPFIISSENGLLSLSGSDIPACEVKDEAGLEAAYQHALKSDYTDICVDSLSDIAESLLGGYLELYKDGRMAYGDLGKVMSKYIRRFRDLKNKNVYFTCKEAKTENNNVLTYAPSMPGNTLTINVPYFFDCVLRLTVDKKGNRILHTATTFTQVCKDRSGKLDKTEEAHLSKLFKKISE